MKICLLPIFLFIMILCFSCDRERNKMIFSESESLLESDPDSALTILDAILYPEDLNKEEYNRYVLLKIQAEYKSYQDITSDSTILAVRDYYLKKKDDHNIALSSYYCGCYYKECGDKNNAMRFFLEAGEYAEKCDGYGLRGLIRNAIGVFLLDQLDCEGAIQCFRESAAFNRLAGSLKNEAISYIQIGDCFQYLEEPDSALHYYMKCLHLIDGESLYREQSNVRQNLGILYAQKGDLAKAIQILKEALEYTFSQDDQIKIYVSLLDLYTANHQIDSANVYMNHLVQKKDSVEDIYVRAKLYRILSEKAELQEKDSGVLEYHKMYAESLLQVIETNLDKSLLELQKKYDYEKVRSHNIRLKLEKTNIFIGFVSVSLLIGVVILFLIRKYRQRKKRILELEEKISQLKRMSEKYDENEKTFMSYLLKHFNVLKKVSGLEIYMNKEKSHKDEFWIKKFNEIVYGQNTLNWDILYDIMNKLHNGFFIKLKELYPQMKEVEFRIICLTYSGFSTEEIAIILNLSINTINTKRSAIRKSLCIAPFANLCDFLDERLKNRPLTNN